MGLMDWCNRINMFVDDIDDEDKDNFCGCNSDCSHCDDCEEI